MHKRNRKEWKNRFLSALLSVAMVLSILPPVTMPAKAAGETFTFSSGAVLLDASYSGDNVIIENGVFSVTVNGATDVNIIFQDVVIDRRYAFDAAKGTTVPNLYNVSDSLDWGTTAQTCPFLITGNSSVKVGFRGTCTFYAGVNTCTVSTGNRYTANQSGAGFAAIQVDSGSSLTIEYAEKLTVYGAHQFGVPDANGNVQGTNTSYSDALRANADIPAAGYDDPWDNAYGAPTGVSTNTQSGGAGIGGGATYNTSKDGGTSSGATNYTAGTPGTIIINGGNIEAFGGHQAAGIGGGTNSAATTDKIVINGGTVIAHGGRWAAGIGDGDSCSGNAATIYGNTKSIEINGGTVTSYGGVASPGIGSTDEKTNNGLHISVNGGVVNAFSGFPDGFNGRYPAEAPAAIGAGAESTMAANSIYVSSAADLSCAGFGNYSLTENGTDANTVPTINIDSDGYLLLLRTEDYYSTAERKLTLYYLQKTEHPETGAECIIYEDQENGDLYYVDAEHDIVYNASFEAVSADDISERKLTLYVDGNSEKIQDIELAYYFRSIALTLPNPEQFGGLYALAVPTDGINSGANLPTDGGDIILTIEAHTQGTQSCYIDFPSQHNLGKDAVSDPFTDLDVNGNATIDGLIGDDFLPEVYAYTVYVEPDTTTANLYFAFEKKDGITYTVSVDDTSVARSLTQGTDPVTGNAIYYYDESVTMNTDEKIIRVKKQDQGVAAISYKVTLIRKGDYNLELTDPSKIYDGQPAKSAASMAYTGDLYTYDMENHVVERNTSDPTLKTAQLASVTGNLVCNYSSYGSSSGLLALDQTVKVIATDDPNEVIYVFSVTATNGSSMNSVPTPNVYRMGWKFTYDEGTGNTSIEQLGSDPESVRNTTWVGNGNARTIAYRRSSSRNPVTLTATTSTSNRTATVVINYNNSNQQTLLQINAPTVQGDSTGTREQAEQSAENAVSSGMTGMFAYEETASLNWNQSLTIYKLNNSGQTQNASTQTRHTVTNTYSSEITGYYQVTETPASGEITEIPVPEEDLKNAVLTYYRVETNGSLTQLDGPPTDAGTYRVSASLITQTYNAAGSRVFTISKRPVTVVQIENWLKYATSAEAAGLTAPLKIDDPGEILLDNVLSGDDLGVTATSVYYNEVSVTYTSSKITLDGVALTGADAHNYTTEVNQTVFGQIAYDMQGAIFRKTENGDWRKYYPVDSQYPVGHASGPTADYHSPVNGEGLYVSHAEYVKARTVNEGSRSARYAVDIEFGPMQFNFYRSIWNVNELTYEELVDSNWTGMDGTNNKLVVTNYSNRSVWYQMSAEIDFMYADHSGNGIGITAKIFADAAGTREVSGTAWSEISQATPGDSTTQGTESTSTRYLMLNGIPQMDSPTYIPVGAITILVSPTDPSSG